VGYNLRSFAAAAILSQFSWVAVGHGSDGAWSANQAVKNSNDKTRRKDVGKGRKIVMPKPQRTAAKPTGKAAVGGDSPAAKKPARQDGGAAAKPAETLVQKPGEKASEKSADKLMTKPVNKTGHDNGLVPALTEDDLRKVKTGLTRKDLERYRQLLLQKRAEILGDVDSLQTDRDSKNPGGGNLSNMPLHMADVGTENYEQEFTLHLVESERALLREINDALMRVHSGTYGVCMETGAPINRARLDAKPWARYSIEVAREKERMGLPS
jgi:RNA polymerase-binding protein DksA